MNRGKKGQDDPGFTLMEMLMVIWTLSICLGFGVIMVLAALRTDQVGAVTLRELSRRAELADRFRERMDAVPAEERPALLAKLLTEDGYAAGLRETGKAPAAGEQLCQHHCPVAHVAEQFPELCEAETEVFARLLGTHVQRLATIAHGDGICTTFVPRTPRDAAHHPTEESS